MAEKEVRPCLQGGLSAQPVHPGWGQAAQSASSAALPGEGSVQGLSSEKNCSHLLFKLFISKSIQILGVTNYPWSENVVLHRPPKKLEDASTGPMRRMERLSPTLGAALLELRGTWLKSESGTNGCWTRASVLRPEDKSLHSESS